MELTVQGSLIIKSENIEHLLTVKSLLTYTFPIVFVWMFLQPILALGLQTLQMLGSYLWAELRTSTQVGGNCNAAGYACPYFFSGVFLLEDTLISLEPLLFKQNSKSCRGLGRHIWSHSCCRWDIASQGILSVSCPARVSLSDPTASPHLVLGIQLHTSLILSPQLLFLFIYFWHNQYGVGKECH